VNTIGERIKFLRVKEGLSAQALGDIVGRSKSNISGYETGKYEPSASTVISLCKHFGVTADWLLTGANDQILEQSESEASHSRFEVYCDGRQLNEVEADLVAMFRLLDDKSREYAFDSMSMLYEKATGEKASIYSTYSDTSSQQKSAPDGDDEAANENA
jgi:Predicted transcriptional regulators